MKNKGIIACAFLTSLISMLLIISAFGGRTYESPETFYKVYLDGKAIGLIKDAEEFYNLVNREQAEIREKFGVDRVYPPNGFNIVRYTTHKPELSTPEDIYAQIKDEKPFTIQGYIITIRNSEEDTTEEIYVLDKDLFDAAAERFINVFVNAEAFEDWKNDTQSEITDTGEMVTFVDWVDRPAIKRGFISTEERIFTDEDTLSQYLLFGTNEKGETYIVEPGDTIESIAFEHQLNTEEFLIANPEFTSEANLLAIGQEVSIALIEPRMELVFDKIIVEDEVIPFERETVYDVSLPASFREVTQAGEDGLRRVRKQMQFINGEPAQGAPEPLIDILQEPVAEITTRGRIPGGRPPADTGTGWGWPTNEPSIITSHYGWRWGKMHHGIDISGTGWGSPIRSVQPGVVFETGSHSTLGNFITIAHPNGYYSLYAHMSRVEVKEGESVIRGQIIGRMGNTGMVVPRPTPQHPHRGTHLHLEIWEGQPYAGGRSINPLRLWGR